MEDYINCYMSANQSKSVATRKTEQYNIKRILKIMELSKFDDFDINTFDKDKFDAFMCRVCGMYEPKTITMTLFSLKNFLEYHKANENIMDMANTYLEEFIQTTRKVTENQKPNKRRTDNAITYPELKDKVIRLIPDNLDTLSSKKLEDIMLIAFYTLIPPRRLGDYAEMEYRDDTKLKRGAEKLNKEKNYICYIGDGKYKVVVNKYKTARRGGDEKLGQFSKAIDNDVVNGLIHKHINNQSKSGKRFLFRDVKGNGINSHALSQKLKRVSKKLIDKEITCDDFRHIYLTHYHNEFSKKSIAEKQEDLECVGQHYKPPTAELYVDLH